MPTVYARGADPANQSDRYPGESYQSGTEFLLLIQNTLQAAGWIVKSGAPNVLTITMEGDFEGDKCWIQYTINGDDELEIRGDTLGDGTSLSQPGWIVINFVPGQENVAFISASGYAMAITSLPFSGDSEILHAGFLERHDPSDSTCICIGKAFTAVDNSTYANLNENRSTSYSVALIHTHSAPTDDPDNPGNPLHWEKLEKGFVSSNFWSSSSSYGTTNTGGIPMSTVLNRNCPQTQNSASFSTITTTNTSYYDHIGANDPFSNKPITGDYYYLESTLEYNDYGNAQGVNRSTPFVFRGVVPFIVSGYSHLPEGSQWDGDRTGKTYITAGSSFQGMEIG